MKINSRMIELGPFDSSHGAIVALGGGPKVVVVPDIVTELNGREIARATVHYLGGRSAERGRIG